MQTRAKRRAAGSEGDRDAPVSMSKKQKLETSAESDAGPLRDVPKRIQVIESTGDLFAVDRGSLLVHACNCQGTWGAGIAAVFKKRYPAAFEIYEEHCDEHGADLLGTCLLIAPQHDSGSKVERGAEHWIGCLFTSVGKGKRVGSKASILEATDLSMRDLVAQAERHLINADKKDPITAIKMCKINSGLFRVPWPETKKIIENIVYHQAITGEIEVITREE